MFLQPIASPAAGYESYFSDSDTVAFWKMDELEDNTYLFDYTENSYDLDNIGFQEGHPCSLFGYGNRPYGSDRATRSLTASPNLMIAGDLTVEGFMRLEHATFVDTDTIINVGHDVFNNQYGYIVWFEDAKIHWKICTDVGTYECSADVVASWQYEFRCTYDTTNHEIAIWRRQFLYADCNTGDYPYHQFDDINQLTKVASVSAYGSIQYNTTQYDWISLAKSWDTDTLGWSYSLSSAVYGQWAISKIVRKLDHFSDANVIPASDGYVNLGSRIRRFDSIHACKIFGQLGRSTVKNYSIDWGLGSFQANASHIPVVDADDWYYTTTVDSVLDEIAEYTWNTVYYVDANFPVDSVKKKCYKTIQGALDAASSGDLVVVYPGTYSEQVTPKTGVTVVGKDKDNTIITRSADVIDSGDSGTIWYNLTFQVTVGNRLHTRDEGTIKFFNCIFTGGSIEMKGSSSSHRSITFTDCKLSMGAYYTIDVDSTDSYAHHVTLINCDISENGNGIYYAPSRNSDKLTLTDCRWTMGTILVEDKGNLIIQGGTYYAEANGRIIDWNGTRSLLIGSAAFNIVAGGDYPIYIQQAPSAFAFLNNRFDNNTATYDLYAVVPTEIKITSNILFQGLHGNIKSTEAIKYVGGSVDFYKTIQDAIDASSSGDLISISSGTYTEQITPKAGLRMKGVSDTNVILEYTINPINWDFSGFCVIDDMNIRVSVGGNNIATPIRGSILFRRCNIGNGTIEVDGDNITTGIGINLTDCSLLSNDSNVPNIKTHGTSGAGEWILINMDGTEIGEPSGGLDLKASRASSEHQLNMINCNMDWGEVIVENNCRVSVVGGEVYSEHAGAVFKLDTNENVSFSNVNFRGGNYSIHFYSEPNEVVLVGNTFSGWSGHDIDADVVIPNVNATANGMGAGYSGKIEIINALKNVGAGLDFFTTVQDALDASNEGDKIVLNEDQAVTSALTPPSHRVLIDGNHQFNITRAAGSPLMTVGASDDVKFVNIDLVGSIDVAGNSAILELADHVYLNGMIDVVSGDASTLIKLDQCKVEGDATDQYCIRIRDADPTIVIKRSNLKGDTADPAIYWDTVTNNNVKAAFSTVMHGSLGANNPFGRSGAQTPNYCSHHSAYNSDPEVGAIWTNLIGTHYDVIDVDADF